MLKKLIKVFLFFFTTQIKDKHVAHDINIFIAFSNICNGESLQPDTCLAVDVQNRERNGEATSTSMLLNLISKSQNNLQFIIIATNSFTMALVSSITQHMLINNMQDCFVDPTMVMKGMVLVVGHSVFIVHIVVQITKNIRIFLTKTFSIVNYYQKN